MDIALATGLAGVILLFIVTLTNVTAAGTRVPRHRHDEGEVAADWSQTARKHLPYSTLKDEELTRVQSREDLERAVIISGERQYGGKPGSMTRNQLYDTLMSDVARRAGDIFTPPEISDLVGTIYHVILDDWKSKKNPEEETQT
jgi:hypothetical protein